MTLSSSDDVDYRSSHTNIAQASSATPFAPPQISASASMPWLGSGQTSMGASVVRDSWHSDHMLKAWQWTGGLARKTVMNHENIDPCVASKASATIAFGSVLRKGMSACQSFLGSVTSPRVQLLLWTSRWTHSTFQTYVEQALCCLWGIWIHLVEINWFTLEWAL